METAEYRCYDDRDGEDLLWNFLVCGSNVAFVKVFAAMGWNLLGAQRYVKGQDSANGRWSVCLRPWKVSSVSFFYPWRSTYGRLLMVSKMAWGGISEVAIEVLNAAASESLGRWPKIKRKATCSNGLPE